VKLSTLPLVRKDDDEQRNGDKLTTTSSGCWPGVSRFATEESSRHQVAELACFQQGGDSATWNRHPTPYSSRGGLYLANASARAYSCHRVCISAAAMNRCLKCRRLFSLSMLCRRHASPHHSAKPRLLSLTWDQARRATARSAAIISTCGVTSGIKRRATAGCSSLRADRTFLPASHGRIAYPSPPRTACHGFTTTHPGVACGYLNHRIRICDITSILIKRAGDMS